MSRPPFFIKTDSVLKRVNLDEIVLLQVNGNYTKFFFTSGKFEILRLSLDAAMKMLPKSQFIRIHRNYAVSFDYVDVVKKDTVTLIGRTDEEYPISRQYYDVFVKRVVVLEPVQ